MLDLFSHGESCMRVVSHPASGALSFLLINLVILSRRKVRRGSARRVVVSQLDQLEIIGQVFQVAPP